MRFGRKDSRDAWIAAGKEVSGQLKQEQTGLNLLRYGGWTQVIHITSPARIDLASRMLCKYIFNALCHLPVDVTPPVPTVETGCFYMLMRLLGVGASTTYGTPHPRIAGCTRLGTTLTAYHPTQKGWRSCRLYACWVYASTGYKLLSVRAHSLTNPLTSCPRSLSLSKPTGTVRDVIGTSSSRFSRKILFVHLADFLTRCSVNALSRIGKHLTQYGTASASPSGCSCHNTSLDVATILKGH